VAFCCYFACNFGDRDCQKKMNSEN
jgi:hypothetical protein